MSEVIIIMSSNLTGDLLWRLVELPSHFDGNNPKQWLQEAKLFAKLTKCDLQLVIEARIKGAAAEKWRSKLEEDKDAEERFLCLFKDTKSIFQLMEEMRNVK